MKSAKQVVQSLLARPVNNAVVNLNAETTQQASSLQLFVMANVTRQQFYLYATINSKGKVEFHVSVPFKFVDQTTTKEVYADKTVYASVKRSTGQYTNRNKQVAYNNSNFGNLQILLTPSIVVGEKVQPNHYNVLDLHNPILKYGLVPSTLETDLEKINTPCMLLERNIATVETALADATTREKEEFIAKAYDQYVEQVAQLYSDGLLSLSHFFINPKPDSVGFSSKLDKSMNLGSNPWLNYNKVVENQPVSVLPIANSYQTVVEIIEVDSLDGIFSSNNNNVLGTRILNANDLNADNGSDNKKNKKILRSTTKVAVISDYYKNTHLLVTFNDTFDYSPVDILESYLAKGLNTFTVSGSLSPKVRDVEAQGSRNGNLIMELRVNSFSPFVSNNVKKVMQSDSFSNLDAVEGVDLNSNGMTALDIFFNKGSSITSVNDDTTFDDDSSSFV